MTQAQLGKKIGASRYWVAEFERGKSGAELGLTLKALRALSLVLTVGTKDETPAGRKAETTTKRDTAPPTVDLSSILKRSITPAASRRDPFTIHDWNAGSEGESKRSKQHPSRGTGKRSRVK